jgi:hypothetical protein
MLLINARARTFVVLGMFFLAAGPLLLRAVARRGAPELADFLMGFCLTVGTIFVLIGVARFRRRV